ncbi:MAG: hypothetical protein V2A73_12215 [Pseudomonadota bacterium]
MKIKRNIYLEMKSLAEARAIFLDRFAWSTVLGVEEVAVANVVGRILVEPVYARLSVPTYHGAAMDGIAVRAQDTYGASEETPVDLVIAGGTPSKPPRWEGPGAAFVNTGDPIPEGKNAVIMIEHVQILDDNRARIEAPAFPWQHVRRVGEDIVATEMLFPSYHRVGPYCTGALLAAGVSSVKVKR